ncbi:hypothetical protein [Rhodopirellula sallentina]|uniref:hypothetical protein n=1 Tax=Rhodopirellula sallentina TaxID=1263869 RepID=UPI0005C7BF63|nr:hypothetical protein [Rhodopirellula sallentina]
MISEGKDVTPLFSECPELMDKPGARERFVRLIEILCEKCLQKVDAERRKQLDAELDAIYVSQRNELIERAGESDRGLELAEKIQDYKMNLESFCCLVAFQQLPTDDSLVVLEAAVQQCEQYESAVKELNSVSGR